MKPKDKASKSKPALLATDSIICDQRLQMRIKGIHQDHVDDIASAINDGRPVERVRVWHVGDKFYLSEGFHRMEAYRKAKADKVPAVVTDGEFFDAVVDAAQSNRQHLGLKRTREDKRNACMRLLEELAKAGKEPWAITRIAKAVDVSPGLARECEREYADKVMASKPKPKPEPAIEQAGEFKVATQAGLPDLFSEPHVPEFRVGVNGRKYPVKPRTPEPAFGAYETPEDAEAAEEARRRADEAWDAPAVPATPPILGVPKVPHPADPVVIVGSPDVGVAPAAPKVFDFKRHDDHVRKVAQAADRLADMHPEFKGSLEYRTLIAQFAAYAETWRKVRDRWEWHNKAKPTEGANGKR